MFSWKSPLQSSSYTNSTKSFSAAPTLSAYENSLSERALAVCVRHDVCVGLFPLCRSGESFSILTLLLSSVNGGSSSASPIDMSPAGGCFRLSEDIDSVHQGFSGHCVFRFNQSFNVLLWLRFIAAGSWFRETSDVNVSADVQSVPGMIFYDGLTSEWWIHFNINLPRLPPRQFIISCISQNALWQTPATGLDVLSSAAGFHVQADGETLSPV